MFLADKFIERARPHPRRERRSGVCIFNLLRFLEKVLHVRNYGALLMQAIILTGGPKLAAWAICPFAWLRPAKGDVPSLRLGGLTNTLRLARITVDKQNLQMR